MHSTEKLLGFDGYLSTAIIFGLEDSIEGGLAQLFTGREIASEKDASLHKIIQHFRFLGGF